MASKTLITVEQYLGARYEREEFVRGELVEKSVPNKTHGRIQALLCLLLGRAGYQCTEVRMRIAEEVYRIPDFAFFSIEPEGEIPEVPPLVVVEIQSPDDRIADVEQKLEEYRTWGVKHIWFVEPDLKKFYSYDRGLTHVEQFDLPEFNLTITPAELFR